MKYKLKRNISKRKIMRMVSKLIPEITLPKSSQCVMKTYGRDYALEFVDGKYYYKVVFLVLFGEAMIYLNRRTSLAEEFVTSGIVKVPFDYLFEDGLIEIIRGLEVHYEKI